MHVVTIAAIESKVVTITGKPGSPVSLVQRAVLHAAENVCLVMLTAPMLCTPLNYLDILIVLPNIDAYSNSDERAAASRPGITSSSDRLSS